MTHKFLLTSGRFGSLIGLLSITLFATSFIYSQSSPVAKGASLTPPILLLGAAWYPEQWPESRWEADLDLMQKAHVHMVRMGEYAWTRDEPEEGHYDLDWLERAINLAGRHGIFVVLGTPSQAPPEWLTKKYPEVLRVTEAGQRAPSNGRENFNWANPKYRELVRGIDDQLAKRFGKNPYVIAWQIDNEYSRASYDENTKEQFQNWLKARYGTLDEINKALDTAYLNRTYTNWNQIEIPGQGENPGMVLAWRHFVSDTWRSYQKNQIDALRKYAAPRQRITTNMMGWFDGYDHYVVARDLDFASWDDPLGNWGHPFEPVRNGATHDLVRGFKNQNFWVMEATAKSSIEKEKMRAALWQDIGHGAETTSYWQWRDALNGEEQNHKGVIVGVDGTPAPIYDKISQVGREYEKAGPYLSGTSVKSEVAILHSYDSRWLLNLQRLNPSYDPIAELMSYYRPFHDQGQLIDIVSPTDDLAKYKLVIALGLDVMPQTVADNLIRYVKEGGNLVLGQRTGMKDENNSRWMQRQPGPLAAILGGRVEQFFALTDSVPVTGTWGDNESQLYAERLQVQAPDVRVLMQYGKSNGWLDGSPAVITRKVGRGTITYFGIWMNDEGMSKATQWMLEMSGVKPDLPSVPSGVEVERRVGSGKDVLVFENFSKTPQTIAVSGAMIDVLHGGTIRSVTLPIYGVAVLSRTAVNQQFEE